jgi:hypothetical protein
MDCIGNFIGLNWNLYTLETPFSKKGRLITDIQTNLKGLLPVFHSTSGILISLKSRYPSSSI